MITRDDFLRARAMRYLGYRADEIRRFGFWVAVVNAGVLGAAAVELIVRPFPPPYSFALLAVAALLCGISLWNLRRAIRNRAALQAWRP